MKATPPRHDTTARLSRTLDSVFRIQDNGENDKSGPKAATDLGLNWLSESIEEKKRNVNTQSQELAAIETRLREAEQRLALVAQSNNLPHGAADDMSRNETARNGIGGQDEMQQQMQQSSQAQMQMQVQQRDEQQNQGQQMPRRDPQQEDMQPHIDQHQQHEQHEQYPAQNTAHQMPRPINPRDDSLGMPSMPGALPMTPAPMPPANDYIDSRP